MDKSEAAAIMGRIGGKSRSEKKRKAVQKNIRAALAVRHADFAGTSPTALGKKLGISRQAAAQRIKKQLQDAENKSNIMLYTINDY